MYIYIYIYIYTYQTGRKTPKARPRSPLPPLGSGARLTDAGCSLYYVVYSIYIHMCIYIYIHNMVYCSMIYLNLC